MTKEKEMKIMINKLYFVLTRCIRIDEQYALFKEIIFFLFWLQLI